MLGLRDNPASRDWAIRKQTLDSLTAENKRLRDMVIGNGGTAVMTARAGEGISSSSPPTQAVLIPVECLKTAEFEIEKLQKACNDKDKRLNRLKEVIREGKNDRRWALSYRIIDIIRMDWGVFFL